jgi:hypothetical protein
MFVGVKMMLNVRNCLQKKKKKKTDPRMRTKFPEVAIFFIRHNKSCVLKDI